MKVFMVDLRLVSRGHLAFCQIDIHRIPLSCNLDIGFEIKTTINVDNAHLLETYRAYAGSRFVLSMSNPS